MADMWHVRVLSGRTHWRVTRTYGDGTTRFEMQRECGRHGIVNIQANYHRLRNNRNAIIVRMQYASNGSVKYATLSYNLPGVDSDITAMRSIKQRVGNFLRRRERRS